MKDGRSALRCQRCGAHRVRIIDSHWVKATKRNRGNQYRRRECDACGYRWSTREYAEVAS